MINFDRYPNFSEDEMRCRCGCGRADMSETFMARLQRVRDAWQRGPIIINSGFRCAAYNAQVSSTGNAGPHTTGHAVDISVAGEDAFLLLTVALDKGMLGIGLRQIGHWGDRFIHVDDLADSPKRPRVWTYR